eukprot:TRINITY_DN12334_c0_g1_i9.p1 TRINITY_DN12334_c0_g1~~TRINITY_DN12334_c0_g1_i9.p1  ORF type:complete len:509 (-),score=100.09 TRINITY_DN12334_c0_g1_i9:1382-2908(-)
MNVRSSTKRLHTSFWLLLEDTCILLYSHYQNSQIVEYLVEKGHSLKTKGHIGFSPKKKNSVISNIWGAAAYNGQLDLLRSLYRVYGTELSLELRSDEKKGTSGGGSLQKELFSATPLMLAVVAGDRNLDVVKWLIEEAECRTDVKDWQQNSILHLAVRYNCQEIVSYLICAKVVDPFERNLVGESAVSMAQALGLEEISKILSLCKDNSGQKMEELLNLINEEEERKEKKKKKKADKKRKKRKATAKSEDLIVENKGTTEVNPPEKEKDEEIVEIGDEMVDEEEKVKIELPKPIIPEKTVTIPPEPEKPEKKEEPIPLTPPKELPKVKEQPVKAPEPEPKKEQPKPTRNPEYNARRGRGPTRYRARAYRAPRAYVPKMRDSIVNKETAVVHSREVSEEVEVPVKVKEEPELIKAKEKPVPVKVKEEPAPAQIKEETAPVKVKEETAPAQIKEETAPVKVKEETELFKDKEYPVPVKVKEELKKRLHQPKLKKSLHYQRNQIQPQNSLK